MREQKPQLTLELWRAEHAAYAASPVVTASTEGIAALTAEAAPSSIAGSIPSEPTVFATPLPSYKEKGAQDEEAVISMPPNLDKPPDARLHLLVPATLPNLHMCRLLYSASVLDYPTPVIVNFKGKDKFDASSSHLAKIHGIQRYINQLPPSCDDDLILIVDAYDVFFQLRADVMIQRYFEVTREADEELRAIYGEEMVEKHNLRETILFGPDKLCWPENPQRPACSAVPDSPLPDDAFGDKTDTPGVPLLARPRWLNSGTIMGPAADLRKLLEATLVKINGTFEPDSPVAHSDQMYLADVWGDQEVARSKVLDSKLAAPSESLWSNNSKPGTRKDAETIIDSEYHVGIDYESALFQTGAEYFPFISWKTHPKLDQNTSHSEDIDDDLRRFLPEDIEGSLSPFSAARKYLKAPPVPGNWAYDREVNRLSRDANLGWHQLFLATNTATSQIFGLFHATGDKEIRQQMFARMWYFPYGEALLRVSATAAAEAWSRYQGKVPITKTLHDSRTWLKAEPGDFLAHGESNMMHPLNSKGGAWVDLGYWVNWEQMCRRYEVKVFGRDTAVFD